MPRPLLRTALVLTTAAVVVAAGTVSALADRDHRDGDRRGGDVQTVRVVGDGDSVTVRPARVRAGTVRFEVTTTNETTGSAVELFRLQRGKTLEEFFGILAAQFSPNAEDRARSTRDIDGVATFTGLADVDVGTPLVVTADLTAGTYNLIDLADQGGVPAVTRLTVTGEGDGRGGDGHSDVRVKAVDSRFLAPRVWPDEGTFSFENRDSQAHFMVLQPVVDGTTDEQVQRALDRNALGDLARPGVDTVGAEVVSPGRRIQVTYDLPRGTYVLLCFIADEVDGMPHAVMGMHRVVVLR